MRIYRVMILATGVLLCGAGAVLAQGMGGGPNSPDAGISLARYFGKDLAFSATAHVSVQPASGSAATTMEMKYSVLYGNWRTDMDLTKLSTGRVNPASAAQLKQLGMDQMESLFLGEKHEAYLIYPGLKAYCSLSSMMGGAKADAKEPKIDRTELGKETIDGHPCVKTKVTATADDGKKTTATIWEATDMKNIPIQIQADLEDGSTLLTTFKDFNQDKPAASLFEVPTDDTKYNSIQEMMMGSMQRMMGGMGH